MLSIRGLPRKVFAFHLFCHILVSKGADPPIPAPTRASDPFVKNEIQAKHLKGARWELGVKNPILVHFSVDILDISQVSMANSDFRLDMNLRQRWTEESLVSPKGLFLATEDSGTRITTDGAVLDDLWTPDVYIPNSRRADINSLTEKHKTVLIFKNKTIIYTSNIFVVLGCPMQFQWYPVDTQFCRLLLESYSYSNDKVRFKWEGVPTPVVLPKNFRLRQFALQTPLNYSVGQQFRFSRGNSYSRLTVHFTFQRELGHHLIQVFIPTFLIVALSWFSFWLGLDAIPGRVSLLVTCMLTLVTMYTGLKSDLPPVSYIKMLDIWMAGCLVFVFAAMSEFIVVRYISHQNNGKEKGKEEPESKLKPYVQFYGRRMEVSLENGNVKAWDIPARDTFPYDLDHGVGQRTKIQEAWDAAPPYYNDLSSQNSSRSQFHKKRSLPAVHKRKTTWERIDNASRIAFPVLFASFMVVYWPVLLYGSGNSSVA